MPIKIVVAGCRNYENYTEAKLFLDDCLAKVLENKKITFLSGGAKGADALGEKYATEKGCSIKKYPANWAKYGKGAGVIRNETMAMECDLVICFWDGKSRGTQSMINLAKKHGKTVKVKQI